MRFQRLACLLAILILEMPIFCFTRTTQHTKITNDNFSKQAQRQPQVAPIKSFLFSFCFTDPGQYQRLPDKVIGVLLISPHTYTTICCNSGHGEPCHHYGFSINDNCYYNVYFNGSYAMLDDKNIGQFGITKPYSLVEMNISPMSNTDKNMIHVKDIRVLDKTPEFPVDVAKTIAAFQQDFEQYRQANIYKADSEIAALKMQVIPDSKLTGPREQQDYSYITWLAQEQVLQVKMVTHVTNGEYGYGWGMKTPPGSLAARYGTIIIADLEVDYEVLKSGKISKRILIPIHGYYYKIPPPPSPPMALN